MKANTVTVHEAKTHLSRLLRKVECGELVTITRRTKPVARLVAIGNVKRKRLPGSMRGELVVGPEFFEPLSKDELIGLG